MLGGLNALKIHEIKLNSLKEIIDVEIKNRGAENYISESGI